ncbi:MAG: enoyl-CoA hydratase-related protein [Antricoccus sp.]
MTEIAERAATNAPQYENILIDRVDQVITITMNRAKRRNSLSEAHMRDLLAGFDWAATTDARIIVLAGDGPVFCSGHDFADMIGRDLHSMRELLQLCTKLMQRMHTVPQIVIARVHGLATAAGCQLVASADLAVAAHSAGFALPGGKGGWFCHTPSVGVSRNVGRKHLMELALTGEPVDAQTAQAWGLINYAVPDDQLDAKLSELIGKLSNGSRTGKALGKQALYNQLDRPESDAYMYAMEVMASASQTDHAREGMNAFVEKRHPEWPR